MTKLLNSVSNSLKITITTLLFSLIFFFSSIANSYEEKGKRFEVEVIGKGSPLILIPGFNSDSRVWGGISETLSQSFEIHKISIAGFGRVPAVESPSLESTKNQLIQYIEERKLDQPIIIGHSLGGFLGLWMESNKPALVGGVISIDGLPFIGPVFSRDPMVSVDTLRPHAIQFRDFYSGLDAQGIENAAKQSIHLQASSQEDQRRIIEMAKTSDPKTAADAIFTLMSTDLRDSLAKSDSKILLLGASGGFSDEASHRMMAQRYQSHLSKAPDATLLMNTTSKHFIMYDDKPWLIEQITSFLTTLD
ncbi:alpha/beta fold hydrolase [Glaciecola sp. KUL10]|uniref:alpha/beta fold hydrolase n=1 Tax=Glaciecola sp. (strain KUL10) TaxID=2161813 RepID=UPI000D784E5D|nr:alpha/beta hydrolase [Glaciecola sp. KUL10]GBL05896.1 hypothetical protein KUL10_32290 [Glaciecola sp. KUL10]